MDYGDDFTMGDYTDLPPHERPGYVPPSPAKEKAQPTFQYATPGAAQYTRTPSYGYSTAARNPSNAQTGTYQANYAQVGQVQYAKPPQNITYTAKPVVPQQPKVSHKVPHAHSPPPAIISPGEEPFPPLFPNQMPTGSHTSEPHNVKVVRPGGSSKPPPSPGLRPHRLSSASHRPDLPYPTSPQMLPRLDRLSVSGNRPDIMPGSLPPPSPMLEPYHGTYQSISPMPSPIMLPDDDIDHLPPLSPGMDRLPSPSRSHSRSHKRHRSSTSRSQAGPPPIIKEKRVKVYDASEDAHDIAEGLGARTPNMDPLIDILPQLSHDQLMELRTDYKKVFKVQGRGINVAKHIKLKTTGNFGKVAYVTALGRWESEGYWANYWYQSASSKRELLIEALMGRTNMEIREIKDAFKDKRYGDSLTRCMDKELKADKFRHAVLLALEEQRQEEGDVWPIEYRNRDVDKLYEALRRREGGETAMLEIVVMRSDRHLRECLKTFERKYGGNFAKEALKKSNNLVGEIIAHILNGVINKPARDALLLHHALVDIQDARDNKSVSNHDRQHRHELLMSRLIRLHWDRMHLIRVKDEYRDKYGAFIEDDIEDATRGDYREFLMGLCEIGSRK